MHYAKKVRRVLNRAMNHQGSKYSNYLENGVYYFSGFWLGRGKKFNRESVITNIENPKSLGIVYSKEKLFQGTEFYSRADESSIRFFDKKNKKILTIFDKVESIKEYLEKNEKGKNYLQPKILNIDYEKLSLEEEYIEHEEIEEKFLFLKILKALREGYEIPEKLEWVNCGEYFSEQHKETRKYLTEEINLENILMPKIFSHGDLHFKNVINTEKELYIIDWDFHGEYIFIFDILFSILLGDYLKNGGYFINNENILREYFEGFFDEEITRNFKCFRINYESSSKFTYLYLAILERIKSHNINLEEKFESEFYGEVIKEIEELYQKIKKEKSGKK